MRIANFSRPVDLHEENTDLCSLYSNQVNGSSIAGIPVVLISTLFVLYSIGIPDISFILGTGAEKWIFYKVSRYAQCFNVLLLLGYLDFNEVNERIDKVIKYIRVSSESQSEKTGKKRQTDPLDAEFQRLDTNEVITISSEWESAKTMLRKNIEKIISIFQNDPESTYCLMLEDVDRLSRADPYEACVFFWIVGQYDVIFYFHNMGYFDFSDPDQQLMAFFGLYRARKDYLNLRARTDTGQKNIKESGGFPARAPYGYFKNKEEDGNLLYKAEAEAEVIRKGMTLLFDGNNVQGAFEVVKSEYEDSDVEIPSYTTFLGIYRKKLYSGKLVHDGEVVGECPAIFSDDEFERLKDILGVNHDTTDESQLDHVLLSAIDHFGLDPSLELFDNIKGCCPYCGDDVRPWGSDKRWGHRVKTYRCVNHPDFAEEQTTDKENTDQGNESADEMGGDDDRFTCAYEGPLLTGRFLRDWEQSVPILCPICLTPADDENWTQSKTKFGFIDQQCSTCGSEFSVDTSADKYERGFELPDFAINWFTDSPEDYTRKENDEPDTSSPGDEDEDDDPSDVNHDLNDFR